MTNKERQNWFCQQCRHHKNCGFLLRNMQNDCVENEAFMSGWEYGQRDTVALLEEAHKNCDIDGNGMVAIYSKLLELKQQ